MHEIKAACAMFLARQKHNVTVFMLFLYCERLENVQNDVGIISVVPGTSPRPPVHISIRTNQKKIYFGASNSSSSERPPVDSSAAGAFLQTLDANADNSTAL